MLPEIAGAIFMSVGWSLIGSVVAALLMTSLASLMLLLRRWWLLLVLVLVLVPLLLVDLLAGVVSLPGSSSWSATGVHSYTCSLGMGVGTV